MAQFLAIFGVAIALAANCGFARAAPRFSQPRVIDEARVRSAGIRAIAGRQLTLYTDLPASEELQRLPEVFDLAVPKWCAYFKIPTEQMANWRMHSFLMVSRERFERAGLLPADLPEFRHGYTSGGDFWLMEQPSDYYRRHLLLHEGTHGFMFAALGSCGPPWYMEGMAELFGTHRFEAGRLALRHFPASREETPMLGRIRMIRDAVAEDRVLTLPQIFNYGSRAHLENEPYAWCWAAAKFLDTHPRYRERFQALAGHVADDDFAQELVAAFRNDLKGSLGDEWRLYIASLDYGYDIERNSVEFQPGQPLPSVSKEVEVRADRGWQSTGIALEGGQTYRLKAAGRYQLVQQPNVWNCEPGGVTIRYFGGQPLGKLLAGVHSPQALPNAVESLIEPWPIGLGGEIVPRDSGTLYLKVNDSPSELADNTGSLRVEIGR